MSNKKSSVGLVMLPTMGFVIGVIIFFVFTAPKIDDYIGGKQAAVLKAVGQGEQVLSSIDVAARFAAWQSLFDLGKSGGFYPGTPADLSPAAEQYPCERYGYTLWNSNNEKCWPDYFDSYTKHFDATFKSRFIPQLYDSLQSISYTYTVGQGMHGTAVIAGVADKTIPMEMSYVYVSEKETPATEELKKDTAPFISSDYGYFSWPVAMQNHLVTSGFGWRKSESDTESVQHAAIDIYAPFKTAVYAAADGRVSFLPGGVTECWGAIMIDHGGGLSTFYLHLEDWIVSDGQVVKRGQRIGSVGHRGEIHGQCSENAYPADHLHFGVLYDKAPKGTSYSGQEMVLSSFGMNTFVQPLCFFDKNGGFTFHSGASSQKMPINSELDKVCKLYNFPEQFLKTREEAAQAAETATSTQTSGQEAKAAENKAAEEKTSEPKKEGETSSTSGLKFISQADYDRVMQYGKWIKEAAQKYEVPEALIAATIYHESKGYTDAVSGKEKECLSGVGLGQFRYTTAIGNPYKDIFGSGLMSCGCCGGQYTSTATIGCTASSSHNCPPTDPRFDAQKSIMAIAAYHKSLYNMFSRYTDKDAFVLMSYFRGAGNVNPSITNTCKAMGVTGNCDPRWNDVVNNFIENGAVASSTTKKDTYDYVSIILKAMSDFGGGSYSSMPSYNNAISMPTSTTIRTEELRKIGFYHINPSFTTSVDYDFRVFESIRKWADYTYEKCHTQNIIKDCVEEQKKLMNDLYAEATGEKSSSSAQTNTPTPTLAVTAPPEIVIAQPYFDFVDNDLCTGDTEGFYDFSEFFEDCMEFGNDKCYCKAPSMSFGSNHLLMSSTGLEFYDAENSFLDKYDFPDDKKITLQEKGTDVSSFTLWKSGLSQSFVLKNVKDNQESAQVDTKTLYFVKKGNVLNQVDDVSKLKECNFNGKHKFRFCAVSEKKIPYYDYEKATSALDFKQVPIRFAFDFKKAIPPPITSMALDVSGVPEDKKTETDALPEDNKCKDFGKAKFTLKVTTKDLQPAYENFISSLASKIVPQLGVLLFAKNFLSATQDTIPALVSVQLDLNGASKECDITGLVYKCGSGLPPVKKDGKFDFSNPTGYVDISSRFNSGGGLSVSSPDACILFKNPDGKDTSGSIRYTKPQISGDQVSFTIDKCADPILQFKKTQGIDIITSALTGFGYYFAFSYVDSAGNYGPATIQTVMIPSVLEQLEDQLGIKDWLLIKDLLMGNYDSILGKLGLDDEWRMIRSALAGVSLDRLLTNLQGEAMNAAYGEIAKNIKNEDAAAIVTDFAKDAVDGRLDESYTDKIIEKLLENIDDSEVDKALDKLLDSKKAADAFINYLEELPDEKKREILEALGEEVSESTKGRVEVTGSAVAVTVHHKDIDEQWEALLEEAQGNKEKLAEILNQLSPEERLAALKAMAESAPDKALQALAEAVGADKKAAAVRSILNSATDAESQLARLIAYSSPDYAKKAALDYVMNLPGYDKYKDIVSIFEDFKGISC